MSDAYFRLSVIFEVLGIKYIGAYLSGLVSVITPLTGCTAN